ncbi:MAG: hypothetical protein EOQ42_10095 [Mesorhizobium sp.]|nr:MAG: hypothetical protein EOQ43_29545 [Mesorhizobium sp.]TGU01139.1 hypothetical protein EN807_15720 [Mesorhizobium sp. M5C.F.Ca.ET.164.01.1.1]RWB77324.1 MAG: hypothetical protein EOQ42_10095 [Mesorhizobium sp.]RWC21744.1 MAG: hypothetical protein EOS51_11525 [Mesorhizobium sp.]RWD19437.1 MAG: hypothetical protein EOS57_12620 [Mesorhizobium sp.]
MCPRVGHATPPPREWPRSALLSSVRTPNGNDYGKDLLRQHHEAHAHDPGPRPPPTLRNKSCSTSYAKAQRNMNFRVKTLEREEDSN